MSGNNIKVVCRFRPMNRLEVQQNSQECIDVNDDQTTVYMKNAASLVGPEKDGFAFDRVFDMESQQQDIFDWGVKGIVEDVMTGFNGTLFCYGQTGSGKTYTMMGADIEDKSLKGLIPRIVEQIFAAILMADSNVEYTVKVSYMEIYMEKIKDLLAPQNDNLSIHEDKARGVYVKGLTDVYVGSEDEVYKVMQAGGASRAVSATNMNEQSSRSHSIFVIGIHQRNTETGSQKSGNLYLVDLAGSEKVGKTGATGQTLEEAKKINKSLSALGMVINALTDGKSSHVPYRDSKLTRILQESLGGNSRTTLIINCSPATYNESETLSTLRFGMRAKSIKNKARVNVEMSPAELKALLKKTVAELAAVREHTAALEEEVKQWRSGNKVDKDHWTAPMANPSAASSLAARKFASPAPPQTPGSSGSISRSGTPGGIWPSAIDSRPDTPTATMSVMSADEREEFLKRENELSDQLAEKESALSAQEKTMADMRDELGYLKERETTLSKDNSTITAELSELRISSGRLEADSKDTQVMVDTYKDRVAELQRDIEEHKSQIEQLKHAQAREKEEEKEKRKQEMLNDMMSRIDMGGQSIDSTGEKLRELLKDLEQSRAEGLSADAGDLIRTHLTESQAMARELQERLRNTQEELDIQAKRRGEVEKMLIKRETAYEELLDRTASSQDMAIEDIRTEFEAKYNDQEERLKGDIGVLNEQVESKESEIERLKSTIDEYKVSVEELNRALTAVSTGNNDGQYLASTIQEYDRLRRNNEAQYHEFENIKRNLVADLSNRCEKVVELEMKLNEISEQYKIVAKSANSRAQQRKLDALEYNLEKLSSVQHQLVEQNISLKKELGQTERLLHNRSERITNLEALCQQQSRELSAERQRYDAEISALRQLQSVQSAQHPSFVQGKIARPLRGGGGGGGGHVPGALSYAGNAGTSPTSRTKHEESTPGKTRQSWFFS